MVSRVQARQPSGRVDVPKQRRPVRGRRRMPDVHHDDVTGLVSGEQMPAANPTECHRDIRACDAVHRPGSKIEPGWAVHRDHRERDVVQPVE
jgi:hypothetical protein